MNTSPMIRLLFSLSFVLATSAGDHLTDRETLFQVSTLPALSQGYYHGFVSVSDLLARGDFGLGTFDGLDGEMVVLDGTIYQVRADGTIVEPSPYDLVPFAAVSHFDADLELTLEGTLSLEEMCAWLEKHLDNPNAFYLIEVTGSFRSVRTRSIAKQKQPYPTLSEAVAGQIEFTIDETKGTAVGIWAPGFMADLNLPGFHFHFISADKKMGGHLLAATLVSGVAEIDITHDFQMILPRESSTFPKLELGKAP